MLPMSFTDAPATGPAPSTPAESAAPGAPGRVHAQGKTHGKAQAKPQGGKAFAAMIDNWLVESTGGTSADSPAKGKTDAASADVPAASSGTPATEDDDSSSVPLTGLMVVPPATPDQWQSLSIQIPVPGDEDAEVQAGDASPAAAADNSGKDFVIAHLGGCRSHRLLGISEAGLQNASAPSQLARAASTRLPSGSPADAAAVEPTAVTTAQIPDVDGGVDIPLPVSTMGSAIAATDAGLSATNAPARKRGTTQSVPTKPASAAGHEIARTLAAAARAIDAPTSVASASAIPAVATPTDAPANRVSIERAPSATVEGTVRRSEPSSIPSIPFADTRDAGEQSGPHDSPQEERRPSTASVRLVAAMAASAGAQVSTPVHDAAPDFSVPTATNSVAPAPIAPAETTPESTPGVHIDPQNVDRIVQSMHVNAKSGVMEATVRLRPEYLGEVTIQLRVDGTGVSAVVHAGSSGVRQWLESQEQSIRGGLAEHGLELSRFVVDPDDRQDPQRDAQRDAEEQQRRATFRRRQAAMAQRFEIVA